MRARQVFETFGWEFRRWHGSHMILTKPGLLTTLSIPDHKELDRGTLRGLISAAGLEVEEFVQSLKDL